MKPETSKATGRPWRTATVTRSKVYPSKAHPGPAWRWQHTVTVTGEPYPFAQEALGSTLAWIKRRFPDARVVLAWEEP